MKLPQHPLFAPALLVIGLVGGWLIASSRHPDAPKPEASAAMKPAPTSDKLDAPAGGFDPNFVKTATVSSAEVPDLVPLSGKLAFDAEKLHLVSARVAGRLDQILVFEGAKVTAGQPLAMLYSPDWISAENELLLARNTVRTFASANQKDLLEDAKATLEAARNRMRVLGAAEADIAQVEKSGVIADHLTLRAPISGVITARNMDPGAFLNVGDNFMTVSDVSNVWFVGNVYEQDYAKVKLGQTLKLTAPALPGRTFTGTVNFIGTNIDPTTHTLPIRCTVANPDGALRPELFVSASLQIGMRTAVVVPQDAVVSYRQGQYVIVETAPNQYRRQAVSTMLLGDGRAAVVTGLTGNEQIVVEGATLINEAMSSR